MGDLSRTVDVRDMLCAQALATVARAIAQLQNGEAVEVLYSAADVRKDLLVWATDRGHGIIDSGAGVLQLTRGTGRAGATA